MLFGRKNIDSDEAARDAEWRIKALLWFTLSIVIAVMTPHLAQLWIDNRWATVSSRMLTISIHDWIEVYTISGLVSLVGFELWHHQLHFKQTHTPPEFMLEMLAELAAKAGVKTPRLSYNPKERFRAATTSSLLFGNVVIWQGKPDHFSQGEIYAIFAHEIAHLAMHDTHLSLFKHVVGGGLRLLALLQCIIMILALAVCFISLFPWWLSSFLLVFPICYAFVSRSEDSIIGACVASILLLASLMSPDITAPMVFAFTTSLVGTILAVLASQAYSRVTEYRADAVAIDVAGPEYADDLARALDKLHRLILDTPEKQKRYRTASIYFMSHPRVFDRVQAMKRKQLKDLFSRHKQQKYT